MIALVRKIFSGVRTHGFSYFVIVGRNEISQPQFGVTQYVRGGVIAVRRLFDGRSAEASGWSEDCLQFVYDLSVAPVTFDFATHLAAAEIERRLRGLAGIDVIFVVDRLREETPDYETILDPAARLWRLRQVLLPMLTFLPSVRGYAVCDTREQANALLATDPALLYPHDYRTFLPRQPDNRVVHEHARNGVTIWPMFRATDHARRLASDFIAREAKGRRPIVITLRNYAYRPQRNSRSENWLAFADSLDLSTYAPIFVHDSETVMRQPMEDFSRHISCDAASMNLEMRMALYEAAWLNMAVIAGPTELCWYNEQIRYLLFVPIGDTIVQPEAMVRNGQRVGCDLDFAKPYQRLVWEGDELATLTREFLAMEALLGEPSPRGAEGAAATPTRNSLSRSEP